MIKVLVVDDSAVAREALTHLINQAPGMSVIGIARDGLEAVEAAQRLRPDIITMDIIMPRLGGPEAIERIMQVAPTPIVIVTGNTITEEIRATFESLESGALALVERPFGLDSAHHQESAEHLINTLRLMSEIKVVRRLPRRSPRPAVSPPIDIPRPSQAFRVVAMGASTGGPSVLKTILSELPGTFPVPILVVQHIAPGFVSGFASWLADSAALTIKLAEAGETLLPGRVYVAPDGVHLGVSPGERAHLSPPAPGTSTSLCPSASHLFHSIATLYGRHAIGVLLTGMGRDGADGLLAMKRAGAITIVQDKESSVIHGMPGEAISLNAAGHVLPPRRIAELLVSLASTAYPHTS